MGKVSRIQYKMARALLAQARYARAAGASEAIVAGLIAYAKAARENARKYREVQS